MKAYVNDMTAASTESHHSRSKSCAGRTTLIARALNTDMCAICACFSRLISTDNGVLIFDRADLNLRQNELFHTQEPCQYSCTLLCSADNGRAFNKPKPPRDHTCMSADACLQAAEEYHHRVVGDTAGTRRAGIQVRVVFQAISLLDGPARHTCIRLTAH